MKLDVAIVAAALIVIFVVLAWAHTISMVREIRTMQSEMAQRIEQYSAMAGAKD